MVRKPRAKKKVRYVRLYTDYSKGLYAKVPFSDGQKHINVPINMTKDSINTTKRGSPFECVLARGITVYAETNPEMFPHPVIYPYVTRSAVYIATKKKNGQLSHAVRYMHGFSQMTKTFDVITKQQFRKKFAGHGFMLILKPGRKYRAGESKVGGNGTGGSRSHKVSRGAKQRAEDAGLIPHMIGDEREAA